VCLAARSYGFLKQAQTTDRYIIYYWSRSKSTSDLYPLLQWRHPCTHKSARGTGIDRISLISLHSWR